MRIFKFDYQRVKGGWDHSVYIVAENSYEAIKTFESEVRETIIRVHHLPEDVHVQERNAKNETDKK